MLIHTFVILSIIFSHCIGLCPNMHNITKKIANTLTCYHLDAVTTKSNPVAV